MEAPLIYVDTTIFTESAIYATLEGSNCRKFIFSYPCLATSPLTFTDALTTITRISGKQQAMWLCDRLAKMPSLSILQSNELVIFKTLENYQTTQLSPKKSMHLAYIQLNNITQIASLDPEFDKIKGVKRVKI
ncbi:MAG: hypothetical protein V1722_02260 [Candidatus Micrarchaeota archaeon]